MTAIPPSQNHVTDSSVYSGQPVKARSTSWRRHHSQQRQKGAIAIVVALTLVAMLALMGLIFDLGNAFVVHSKMQTAADACALGAVRQMDSTVAGLTRSRNAGQAVVDRNNTSIPNLTTVVKFGATLSAFEEFPSAADAALAKYARCELANSGNWVSGLLMKAAGYPMSVKATAEMGGANRACSVPLAVCARDPAAPADAGGNKWFGLYKGEWVDRPPPGGGTSPGFFGWASLSDAFGASEFGKELAGPGYCDAQSTGQEIGNPGLVSSLSKPWNMRFGINSPGAPGMDSEPDYTGYSFENYKVKSTVTTPTGATVNIYSVYDRPDDPIGVVGDLPSINYLKAKEANLSYLDSPGTLDSLPGSPPVLTRAQLSANGRDRRMVLFPVVNCSTWVPPAKSPVIGWMCGLMVKPWAGGLSSSLPIEIIGPSSVINIPCGQSGVYNANSSVGRVAVLVQ